LAGDPGDGGRSDAGHTIGVPLANHLAEHGGAMVGAGERIGTRRAAGEDASGRYLEIFVIEPAQLCVARFQSPLGEGL
jgi:hypothetical protein